MRERTELRQGLEKAVPAVAMVLSDCKSCVKEMRSRVVTLDLRKPKRGLRKAGCGMKYGRGGLNDIREFCLRH